MIYNSVKLQKYYIGFDKTVEFKKIERVKNSLY